MRVGIMGAGSIGCYVGGRLAAAGAEVTLVGRERIGSALREHGLHLTSLDGADRQVPPDRFRFATDAGALAEADLVLVTVKSAATEDAGRQLAPSLPPGAMVVSFQNGLGNADVLRRMLPGARVITGMIPFNVVNCGDGHFHQGSEGVPEAEAGEVAALIAPVFERAGIPLKLHGDMRAVLWAKLLLNLNNVINALANEPLRDELSQRDYRRCLAAAQEEALEVLAAAGIEPARLTPIPPRWLPSLLRVPDWLFRVLANRMLEIDPLARSSMWEDLEAGRVTEIDWLNGEVVRLGAECGVSTPVNRRLVELIRQAESGDRKTWSGVALLGELRAARSVLV